MKVKDLSTGKAIEVNASFAARLFEQGKAVPVPSNEKKSRKKAVSADGAEG